MSIVQRKIQTARETAEALGHRLGAVRFQYGLALIACVHCDATLSCALAVERNGDALAGVAATLPCRNGGSALEAPPPAPRMRPGDRVSLALAEHGTDDGLNHPDTGIATMPGEDRRTPRAARRVSPLFGSAERVAMAGVRS